MKQTRVQVGSKQFILNPNQKEFLRSNAKYVAYVGGRGCGKSLALVLKIIELSLRYKNNAGLLGREDYSDLRDSTEKDFFDVCPTEFIHSHNKQEKKVVFINGSTLIFRGLKDVSKTSIRSLNLGFVALEQAEEIDESLVNELSGCMRRKVFDDNGVELKQQMFILANPWMGWIFKKFKQEKANDPEHKFIGGSMMDNIANLGESFIKDQTENKPESWIKVMVYGQFDESALNEAPVFDKNLIDLQTGFTRPVLREIEGITIYEEPIVGHQYQIGADPSEGIDDNCVAKCIDILSGKEVASYVGRMQPDSFGYKINIMGNMFWGARVVLEINGIGLATLDALKNASYPNIYMREEFDKIAKTITRKLGWKTSSATKPLLISNFNKLMSDRLVKISDSVTLSEMRSFRYTDEAKRRGMGGIAGFHDDRVMATALAYWQVNPMLVNENLVIDSRENKPEKELLHLEEIFAQREDGDWRQY